MRRFIECIIPLALSCAVGCEGATGPAGAAGPAGTAGTKGDKGDPGDPGADGQNGTNGTNGTNGMDATAFDFRTDAPSAYTRVDRMGMPAVATALISAAGKEAYNDADPNDDVTTGAGGLPMFVGPEIAPQLAGLHAALADDFAGLGLTACANDMGGGNFDVIPCATQTVGNNGPSVLSLVVPDTLTLDLAAPSGFPNGRRLEDPVIDVTLAVILLDLNTHSPALLATLPLNPPANDVQLTDEFPYLGYPHTN